MSFWKYESDYIVGKIDATFPDFNLFTTLEASALYISDLIRLYILLVIRNFLVVPVHSLYGPWGQFHDLIQHSQDLSLLVADAIVVRRRDIHRQAENQASEDEDTHSHITPSSLKHEILKEPIINVTIDWLNQLID